MTVRRVVGLALVLVLSGGCTDGGGAPESTRSTDTRPPDGAAAVASPGCENADAVSAGEATLTMTSGAMQRSYIRHVPPGYSPTEPTPLVLDFHGSAETAQVHVNHSALGPYGDERGFVTITPQGMGTGLDSYWDTAFDAEIDSADVRFVGDLLDELERTLCIDERRVYATGYSNGAFLTSALACVYADRFAAMAPVAGLRDHEGCDPARAVPLVVFHGTDDEWVAFDGGLGPAALALPPDSSGQTTGEKTGIEEEGPSVPTIVATWATRNGCPEQPSERDVASDVTLVRYACRENADIDFYRIEGGGHTWPGSAFSKQIEPVIGPTTFSISANEIMWEFFTAHPLPNRD
jgi:polyhydroxybutyrate depolymerase